MDKLLAKSPTKEGYKITLSAHLKNTLNFADLLLKKIEKTELPRNIEDNWNDIKKIIQFTSLLHDLGKANNIFQSMLSNESVKPKRQIHPVRHEVLSMLILTQVQNKFREILKDTQIFNNDLLTVASWIIGGHHLRLEKNNLLLRIPGNPQNFDFIFYGSNMEISDILERALQIFGSKSTNFPLMNDVNFREHKDEGISLKSICEDMQDSLDDASVNNKQLIAISASKALLIAADVINSAFEKLSINFKEWIDTSFETFLCEEDLKKIISTKIGDFKNLYDFQRSMGMSNSRVTLITAGCGNGKTVGAYEWARTHALGRKLFFCYPTTGTTSAGFRDYLLAQTDIERSLLHSRSYIDLELMITDAEEYYKEEDLESTLAKDAISCWNKKVIACTADSVLGIIQNHRSSIINFPLFFNSAFVFDEVHSYDSDLFGALLRFIQIFDRTPVLLMSASIQKDRINSMNKILNNKILFIGGVPELEKFPRYLIESTSNLDRCWDIIKDTIYKGGKILYVCNRVNTAIHIYEEACNLMSNYKNLTINIYHSRFRYRDRVKKQQKVLSLFNKKNPDPCLVISTQVCEMSLDISADLLITEICPFPSFIQRLGRLNRRGQRFIRNSHESPNCILIDETKEDYRPYEKNEIDTCRKIIKPYIGTIISQKKLSNILETHSTNEKYKEYSSWLDYPGFNEIGSLRKYSYTIDILLENDLPEILKKLGINYPSAQLLNEWTIPMIYKKGIDYSKKFGRFPVINDQIIAYDEQKGAKWR